LISNRLLAWVDDAVAETKRIERFDLYAPPWEAISVRTLRHG
jgi:hypothetical protein